MRLLILIFLSFFLPLTAWANNGIYFTLESGLATQNSLPDKEGADATHVDTKLSPPVRRIAVGYNHDINSLFGLGFNVGLGWYGKTVYHYSDGSTTKIQSKTSEFLVTEMYHFNPKIDFFSKIGGVRLSPEVSGKNANKNEAQIRFEVALGTAYIFNQHWATTLTYAHVFGKQAKTISDISEQTPSLNELLLGVRYTFG